MSLLLILIHPLMGVVAGQPAIEAFEDDPSYCLH